MCTCTAIEKQIGKKSAFQSFLERLQVKLWKWYEENGQIGGGEEMWRVKEME